MMVSDRMVLVITMVSDRMVGCNKSQNNKLQTK